MSIGIVETSHGKVSGVELEGKYDGITLFKGIPYAKPPIGRLRWAPPEEAETWPGVRTCNRYGDACPQILIEEGVGPSLYTGREYHYMGPPPMSEDCLYLNICTGASSPDEKRPVYIWYHGGGLVNGYSYEVEFDPSELAARGIVVVQVGQRLNLFGFLALPQLTAEQGRSGNYGLMDQIKALDWIYRNINSFGGDKENITVGGESGGCIKASVIAAIPASGRKIGRVINQSGNMWLRPLPTMEEEEKTGLEFLKALGLPEDIALEELRNLDVERLMHSGLPRRIVPNNMVIDGGLIPFQLNECFDRYLEGVDFLNGSNLGEADVFGKPWWICRETIDTREDFYGHYKELLGDLYDKYDFENLITPSSDKLWFIAKKLAALGLAPYSRTNLSRNVMINRIFGMYLAKKYPGSSAYTYLWCHMLPEIPEDKGTMFDPDKLLVFHSSELWFVFNSLRDGVPTCRKWRESDFILAENICTYWANFISTGNPNGDKLPYWAESGDDFSFLFLNEDMNSHRRIDSELDSLIRDFVFREYDISF